ncbi:MAG: glycosyltransferase family 4 protein [Deltaproteobacteria bacterium]|nr:glycosyltransferase family 4 protein [Deltaproteobacteria bacterium]
MKIGFYTPFKPLGHPHPSGDLVTATGIFEFLERCGHQVVPASSLRCRWIYWKPWVWPRLVWERQRVARRFGAARCDLWFSYHSYYKAPDMLGPAVARRIGIPYVLFQGIYSTRRRRDPRTRPGFHLNRQVLLAARHVFTNKRMDWVNLRRLLPEERLTYVAPGLHSRDFTADPVARAELRRQWSAGEQPVVLSVAMFRPGVKAEGLTWVIRTCGELRRRGLKFTLAIVGDGKERARLERLARDEIRDGCIFTGQVPRQQLYRYYSAADLFVFPGIQEALGMVYLEAQSCGLPVVAFDNAGVPEAVQDGRTGLLVPMRDGRAFAGAIARLLADASLRRHMGASARTHIREAHELDRNYGAMEEKLKRIIKPSTFSESQP